MPDRFCGCTDIHPAHAGSDRSAGRWCDHCQQHGSHHTDRHEEFARYFDEHGRHLGYCNSCGEEAEIGQECCEAGEVVQYEDDEVEFW